MKLSNPRPIHKLGVATALVVLLQSCVFAQTPTETPRLYWSNTTGLERVRIDDPSSLETVFPDSYRAPIALALDPVGGKIYMNRRLTFDIWRTDLDGGNDERFSGPARFGRALDVDPVDRVLYWTDVRDIRWRPLDGSMGGILLTEPSMYAFSAAIAVDPVGRKIYWAAHGHTAIRRANLDGTGIEDVLVHPDLRGVSQVRVDGTLGRLYVLLENRIGAVNVDGTNPKLVHAGSDIDAFTLDRPNTTVYWEDDGVVKRADYDGSNLEELFTAQVSSMSFDETNQTLYALDASERGPFRVDLRAGSEPEYLWDTRPRRVSGEVAFDAAAGRMYWHDQVQIMRASLDGDRRQRLASTGESGSVVLDGEGRMYWNDSDTGQVFRARSDGSESELVGSGGTLDLEIDRVSRKLYTLVPGRELTKLVVRTNYDGSELEYIQVLGSSTTDIELDPDAGFLYYSCEGAVFGCIGRIDLSGGAPTIVHANVDVVSIAVDPASAKIYWSQRGSAMSLRRSNLDGSGIEDLLNVPLAYGLSLELGTPTSEFACRVGNVNADGSGISDALLVNGSAGDANREMSIMGGSALRAEMVSPPTANGRAFLVHANLGVPGAGTVVRLPFELGRLCFPIRLSQGAMPAAIWNGIGQPQHVGASTGFDGMPIPDPGVTPYEFLTLPNGDPVYLPVGTTVTFQGIVQDPSSAAARRFGVTNAVVVHIQ